MRKVKLSLTLLVLVLLMGISPDLGVAQALPPAQEHKAQETSYSLEKARQSALKWIVGASQHAPGMGSWNGATVGGHTEFVDLESQPVSVVFSVVNDKDRVGYVTVDVQSGDYIVLEAGLSDSPARNVAQAREIAGRKLRVDPSSMDVVRLHTGSMAYLAQFTVRTQEGSKDIVIHLKSLEQVPSWLLEEAPRGMWNDRFEKRKTVSSSSYSGHTISGVPYYIMDDHPYLTNHCGPTSGANIYGYWDDHGYPNLWPGYVETLIGMLYNHMGTNEGHPGTYVSEYAAGMESYADERGYAGIDTITYVGHSYEWSAIKAEMNADRPIGVLDWSRLHWVTGAGWYVDSNNYIITHNGWDRYQHFLNYTVYWGDLDEVFVRP
jgi:hypothetical protein